MLFAWLFYFYFIKVLFLLLSAELRENKKREIERTTQRTPKKMFLLPDVVVFAVGFSVAYKTRAVLVEELAALGAL